MRKYVFSGKSASIPAFLFALIVICLSGAVACGQEIRVTELSQQKLNVTAGQYSGIAYLGGERYAVVDDKLPGGGIVFFDLPLWDDGSVRTTRVRRTVPDATLSSDVSGRDNEGVAFVDGRLYISAEADQSIREYDMDGRETGRAFPVPVAFSRDSIEGNAGFEALTYNAGTGKFWTTTELPLKADGKSSRLHRLLRFDGDFQPDACFLYQMDEPRVTGEEASSAMAYVCGIAALTALDDGRLIVLEREVCVPRSSPQEILANAFSQVKLYLVSPSGTDVLTKQLLHTFETRISMTGAGINVALANYEGMCLGPRLRDGRRCLILIADSQAGMAHLAQKLGQKRITQEFVKVLVLEGKGI